MLKVYLSPTMRHAVLSRHGFCCFLGLDKFFASILALSMPILNGKTTLKNPFTHPKFAMQAGYSLLELILVLGLMSIIAIGSVTMLVDDGDWKRQDETEKRWDAIRKAIIGEPNLSLNGSPYVVGYVADMGRLPVSVVELIDQNVTFDHDNDPDTAEINRPFDHDRNGATAVITIEQPAFTDFPIPDYNPSANYINTVGGGWRGPYLYTAGSQFYRDGWNNQDAVVNNDAFNFGWNIVLTGAIPDITDIAMQSLGLDNQIGGVEENSDYPTSPNQTMVGANEWTLSASPITFNVDFNRAVRDYTVSPTESPPTSGDIPELDTPVPNTPHQLQLKIYRYTDNGDNVATFNEDITEIIADTTFELSNGLTQAPAQTIDLQGIPIGRFAAVIWCTQNDNLPEATANYTNDVVYDGDCDGGNIDHSPVYFTLTHNTTQVTITWNLP